MRPCVRSCRIPEELPTEWEWTPGQGCLVLGGRPGAARSGEAGSSQLLPHGQGLQSGRKLQGVLGDRSGMRGRALGAQRAGCRPLGLAGGNSASAA